MRSLLFLSVLLFSSVSNAHFQELIPSMDSISESKDRQVLFDIRFTHPTEMGPVMHMKQPQAFSVVTSDGEQSLLDLLKPVTDENGSTRFKAGYQIKSAGDHLFYITPEPYWEPAEGVMIQHFTKVVVDAYAGEELWDQPIGLPVEIEPLTRPYGLWTGNLFQGRVLKAGKPVPHAEVEVEWRNDGSLDTSKIAHPTQLIKADQNGVFSYAMPRSGWWGFAALLEADEKMKNPKGEPVAVEQGALIWVKTTDMK